MPGSKWTAEEVLQLHHTVAPATTKIDDEVARARIE